MTKEINKVEIDKNSVEKRNIQGKLPLRAKRST